MIRLPAAKPRILLVTLDNVGDVVFTSALVPPLLAAWPDAIIDVWAKRYTHEIARLIPGTRRVIAADPFWDAAPGQPRGEIIPFLRSIVEVRAERYDIALLSNAPWRAAAAVSLSGIRVRVGLARHRNARFLTHVLPTERHDRSVLLEQARLLEPLGIDSPDPRYVLDPARLGETRDRVRALLPPRFAALHPFAGDAARCVPIGEWTQIAFALAAQGIPVLWVGRPDELNALRASVTHPRGFYVDLIDDGSFSSAAAAVSLATFLVGHDSGPLHVAGAFGVPVVGVFAPGEPLRTYPQGIGPSRMLAAPAPAAVDAAMILREIDALGITSAA